MNGGHDLGGMHGFGPIDIESGKTIFHAEWEQRVFALTLAVGALGEWNIDASRAARESMEPGHYLTSSYYEHWLHGLEVLLADRGMVSDQEVAERLANMTPVSAPVEGISHPPDKISAGLRRGSSAKMADSDAARFVVGDVVTVTNANPRGHTRVPGYVRGRQGTVMVDHGTFIFPDSHAATGDPSPQHCYAVRFTANELWGAQGEAGDDVVVDLWDDYMERA